MSEDDKPHVITGDDVQAETPPTPVKPNINPPPAKENEPAVKPAGVDQRPNR